MFKKSFILSLLSLFFVTGCENPIDDFNIHVAPTFYKYVIEVELSDLSDPTAVFDGDVEISVTGEDASSIYGMDGKKEFKVNFGSLQLITTRSNEPTEGNPLRFTVMIESDDYRSASLDIEVGEEDYYVSRSLSLLDLSNLPTGINTGTTSGTLQSNGELTQNLVFQTDSTNANPSQLALTVPTGVKFMTASGSVISGSNLKVDVLNFNDTTQASQLSMPGNTGALQKVMINGVEEDILLDPGATFEIDMSVDGEEVKKFSNDIELSMPLPAHMYNYEEDRPYQAGDKVSLISHSSGSTSWANEGEYTVVNENGKLMVKPTVNHLSYYKMMRRPQQTPPNKITFINSTSKPINSSVHVHMLNHIGHPSTMSARLNLAPGGDQVITYHGYGILQNVQLYQRGSTGLPDHDIAILGNNITVTFTEPENSIEVGYKLFCSSTGSYINPLPAGVKMYYRKTAEGSSAPYKHLHTFVSGDENTSGKLIKINKLEAGVNYDFRALYNEHQVDTNNVLVVDKKMYIVDLPKAVCDQIGI